MKITKIEQEGNIYTVTFTPNWWERLFGYKEKSNKYKDTYLTYTYGGGHVYVNQEGKELSNTHGYGSDIRRAIDNWRRRF